MFYAFLSVLCQLSFINLSRIVKHEIALSNSKSIQLLKTHKCDVLRTKDFNLS